MVEVDLFEDRPPSSVLPPSLQSEDRVGSPAEDVCRSSMFLRISVVL